MYKLLFVDDEPSSLLVIQSMINWSKFGITVCSTVSNGEAALKYIEGHEVHAVITDLQMPGMDGITLIKRLRDSGFSGPILALSNYDDYSLVRGALTAGAYDYLLKISISRQQLESAIVSMLEKLNSSGRMTDTSITGSAEQHSFADYINGFSNYDCADFNDVVRYPAITVSIFLHSIVSETGNIINFLRAGINDLFHPGTVPFVTYIYENEFLVVLQQGELSQEAIRRKLEAFLRQVGTFFPIAPYMCCSSNLQNPEDIRKYYSLVSHGSICTFYERSSGIVQINLQNTNETFHSIRENMLSSVLSMLHGKDIGSAQTVIAEFSELCARNMIAPPRVKNAFIILIWCCKDIGVLKADNSDLRGITDSIEQVGTASSIVRRVSQLLAESAEEGNISDVGTVHPEVAKAVLYIHKHYGSKITLDEVAKHAGLNKEYISRLFIKEMGINMFKYILDLRMSTAGRLMLSNPEMLIKDVAAAVGFDNQYFFSTKFKEYFGVSPNQYRSAQNEDTL